MTNEQTPRPTEADAAVAVETGKPVNPEAMKYLEMLDLTDFADFAIPDNPGKWEGLKLRDFLEICGDHAINMLRGLAATDPNSAEFEMGKTMVQGRIAEYIQPIIDEQTKG